MDELFVNSPVVKIKVIGCGGAGNNSIDRMLEANLNLDGVDFIAINTDGQVLNKCRAETKLCIGEKLCKRQGCGGDPAVGQAAAEESRDDIRQVLEGTDLVFITAGMGGGTGTGASPVVAAIARELGILTVAVVSKPFDFEGSHRILNAEIGISNLEKFVDAIVIVPNQKIVENYKKLNIREAFKKADEVLQEGVMGLAELIVTPMLINLDFADIRTVLRGAGKAHMGIGKATGDNRVLSAIQRAVSSPLLETNITGATRIIMCVKGGEDLDFGEVSNCGTLVRDAVDPGCNIIHGVNLVSDIADEVQVLIVAAGFPESNNVNESEMGGIENPIPTDERSDINGTNGVRFGGTISQNEKTVDANGANFGDTPGTNAMRFGGTAENGYKAGEPFGDTVGQMGQHEYDEPTVREMPESQDLARPKFFGFFKNFKR